MANEHLATYLNDHLAGSVGAVDLLAHLEAEHAGTVQERIFAQLRADIEAERQELKALMDRLDIAESRPRKASAWLAEKVTQLKLHMDDPSGGELRLLESLDALTVGIQGKQALWRALAVAAEDTPELQGLDYAALDKRSQEQQDRAEAVRLEAARAALGAASDSKERGR